MNKIVILITIFLILGNQLMCQESKKWLLFDKDTKTPIEFAHIINLNDQDKATLTNQEGEFTISNLSVKNDSFYISHLGYPEMVITNEEILNTDTIFLKSVAIKLGEVVLYDIKSILEKVYENIPNNYPTTGTDENFFFRYFTKQNGEKFQIVESIVNLKKQGYFSYNKKDKNEIIIYANSAIKNDKLENNIEFQPYSFQETFQMIDVQIPITNNYELTTETIEKGTIKILFKSTDTEINKSGEFAGYLIINLADYAILEMFYEKNYIRGNIIKDLKKGFKTENIYKSGLRRWKQDKGSRKYRLELMLIDDDLELTNSKKDLKLFYEGSYIVTSLNTNPINFETNPITVKSKRKKVIDYKSINEEQVKGNRIILKTKEQQFER